MAPHQCERTTRGSPASRTSCKGGPSRTVEQDLSRNQQGGAHLAIRYRSLTEDDLENWYDHVGSIFTRAGRQYFVNHYRNDPWAFTAGVLVAEDTDAPGSDGRPAIVSTVRVFDRRLFIRGREVRTGGIGEVSTKPAYRRQGHSGHLLTMASELMARHGMPLSLLFADRFGHYGRYGWRQIKLPVVAAAPQPGGVSGRRALSVRPLDFDTDRDLMMRAYADLNHRLSGPIVRDCREYWDRWVRCEIRDQGTAFIADGRPVGFGRFHTHGETLAMSDLGILAESAQWLPGFLSFVAAEARRPLVIHAALYRRFQAEFDALFTVTQLAPHLDQMFKLIDGTRFLGTVFAGAATALPDGPAIRLEYESGSTDIRSAGGQLRVSAAEPPGMTVSLTDAQLLALVLVGWERLAETGVERPAVTEVAGAVLSELFTPAGWSFWEEDAF